MPKQLSLKKVQPGSQKNQKAITHFFKNTNEPNGCGNARSAQEVSDSFGEDKTSNKRKATSPVIVEITKNDCLTLNQDKSSDTLQYNTNGNAKKLKNESLSTNKSKICKKSSPHKENVFKISQSPNKSVCKDDEVIQEVKLKSPDEKIPLANSASVNVVRRDLFDNDITADLDDLNSCGIVSKESSPVKHNLNHEGRSCLSKKSPNIKEMVSQSNNLRSSQKCLQDDWSPSKGGSTVKSLHFCENEVNKLFDDDWAADDIEEDYTENLDLSSLQRCEVMSVIQHQFRLELKLKNQSNDKATCFVEGIWLDTPLHPGEIVSIQATRDSSGAYSVGNGQGLLVLRPDYLVSSTSVVAGVFCRRKAVLQERWKGIDSANTAMTTGILIHELVQKALTQRLMDVPRLRSETDAIIKESIQMLYDAGINEEETRSNMQAYIQPLAEFMQNYVGDKPLMNKKNLKDAWSGHIDKVLDIEENVCCPQLGLKGKIDATLEVTIHNNKGKEKAVVPLELKSGKASMSAEHRGQLVLYGMMLSLADKRDPTTHLQRALLLYLRDRVDIREVSCGYPERRDLVMLRNQLVQHLAPGPLDPDPEQLVDIEEAAVVLQQNLPDPVHHQTACAKCPYLTICSLHLWHTAGPTVSENHPLTKLKDEALGFLSKEHIRYFLHWTALIKMEEKGQMNASPLHALWTESVESRIKRGVCIANLKIKSVQPAGDRYLHTFKRCNNLEESSKDVGKGPQEGEYSIVSIDDRPWVAAGVITRIDGSESIEILLERDLSKRSHEDAKFHVDTYESYATAVQNLTNLGVLMEDSDRAQRLRKIIIDKEQAVFEKKLPREVGRLGTKLMKSLNIEQQRAVLKALAAKDYALLRGLPGTGKTQTISVLIQMLVGLKKRVLVTAHTHSAVDNVLSRLPESIRVMRLGSSSRVLPSLLPRCEQTLAASCGTVEQLTELYESMEVVGVTCLGAAHAMLSKTMFDVCIVDEATQVLQCTVLRPLFAATRFVLVGDPDQLPPVVKSKPARRLGAEESLFHRLISEDATCTLQLQYRMNQAVVDVANKVAYDNRLKCANQNVAQAKMDIDMQKISNYLLENQWLAKACSVEPENAVLFIDTKALQRSSEGRNKLANTDEACLVLALIDILIRGGVKPSDIGAIAPYREQVSLLRRCLQSYSVEASTVDQFQGRDKSVILYSCTRRYTETSDCRSKEGEVLNDQRRLAVSVTRAKHKLIIIGDSRALKSYVPLQKVIEACQLLNLEKKDLDHVVEKYCKLVSN